MNKQPIIYVMGLFYVKLVDCPIEWVVKILLLVGLNEGSTTCGKEVIPILLTAVKNFGQYNFL